MGDFSYRWPSYVEQFAKGWDSIAVINGRAFRLRHGVGRRDCFGRARVHTVTWLEGEPSVEGAEAEDYPRTHALISLIKRGMRDVRDESDLPGGYNGFEIVRHRDEIHGPFARQGLAVK